MPVGAFSRSLPGHRESKIMRIVARSANSVGEGLGRGCANVTVSAAIIMPSDLGLDVTRDTCGLALRRSRISMHPRAA